MAPPPPLSPEELFQSDIEALIHALEEGESALVGRALIEAIRGAKLLKHPLLRGLEEAYTSIERVAVEERKHLYSSLAGDLRRVLYKTVEKEAEPKKIEVPDLSGDRHVAELFLNELEERSKDLTHSLLALERGERGELEELMHTAHSIKGAARTLSIDSLVKLFHSLEDLFSSAQRGEIPLEKVDIELLLRIADLLARLSTTTPEGLYKALDEELSEITHLTKQLKNPSTPPLLPNKERERNRGVDKILRITAHNLSGLMGLAGESLVQSRWLSPFGSALLKLKKQQNSLMSTLELLQDLLKEHGMGEREEHYLKTALTKLSECRQSMGDRLSEFEMFSSRYCSLSSRLYREVIDCRMRPFCDGIESFPRLVRDLAKELGKQASLTILGGDTPVDREILEKLESPLAQIIRNCIDHGIESPQERIDRQKPPAGSIQIKAEHRAGMLAIAISDDGKGIDIVNLRRQIIAKGLLQEEICSKLSREEILEFIFLPNFSTASSISQISGRGIGLSIVQKMVQEVGGRIEIKTEEGVSTRIHLQLPLTLSVIRSLLVQIYGEPYAFPLNKIDQAIQLRAEELKKIEQRYYFNLGEQHIGLISAHEIFGLSTPPLDSGILNIIVASEGPHVYGIVVDHFIGEKELVVHELDPLLGKIKDISSGAFMEDGSPILIVDVDDMIHSLDKILAEGSHCSLDRSARRHGDGKKRILLVEDSLTVREMEARLLRSHGYGVDTAVNGADGWNALKTRHYDLVITDVDMPRMNGIELLNAIRSDPKLGNLPVIIVSYKEGEEDRRQGLEAGAQAYLNKSSFQNEQLIATIYSLIGANQQQLSV